jgi:hypothetical protein
MDRENLEYTEMELAVPSQARNNMIMDFYGYLLSQEGKKEIATSILIVCFQLS